MAFCMWKMHSSISKSAKYILPNCNLSRNVLKNIQEITPRFRCTTYSSLPPRPAHGHKDKRNDGCVQLKNHTCRSPEEWCINNNLQQKGQLQTSSKKKLSVNLSDLYACDPLAILLHSHLQIYNNDNNLPGQRQYGPKKTKGYERASRDTEPSFLYSKNTAANSMSLSDEFHQTTFSSFEALPCYQGSVAGPILVSCEAVIASCALGSVAPPPTNVALGSPVFQHQTLAQSSLNQCSPPLPQPGSDQSRKPAPGSGEGDPYGLPSPDQLQHVQEVLIKSLSELFVRSMNYSIYHPKMIFENRIRGTVTKGMGMYSLQVGLLNILGHFKFAHVRFDIIKITQHPEEGTIKVRWRIKGVKTRHGFVGFIKSPKWSVPSVEEQTNTPNWYDGFSTFYVNSAGLVTRHVADNMMPDDDKVLRVQKPGLFGRLAVLFGLFPKATHSGAMIAGQLSEVA